MATAEVVTYNKYQGNGATTEFSIGFPYLNKDFIKIYIKRLNQEEQELDDSLYDFANDTTIRFPALISVIDDTGQIIQVEATEKLKTGEVLTIQRETPLKSDYIFTNQKRLFPEDVMDADDLSFQQIQELARNIDRCVKVTPTGSQTPKELLDDVYEKLDTATVVSEQAKQAAAAAESDVNEARELLADTALYVTEKTEEIDNLTTTATNTINSTRNEAVATIGETKDTAISTINTAIDEAEMDISDIASDAENTITATKNEAVSAVNTAIQGMESTVSTATASINATKTAAETSINNTKNSAVTSITSTKDEAVSTITTTKETAEASINATKEEAESNISDYVDEAIEYVKEEGVKAAKGAIKDVTDAAKEAKDNADIAVAAADRAEEAVKTVTGVYRVKGSVQSYSDLPKTGQQNGDVYNVLDTGANYVWDGTNWDKLSETVDLSNYVTLNSAQTITGEKTFNNSVTIDLGSVDSRSLKVKGSGGDQAFLLERTSGATCVLEAGNSIGLFGTKTQHPIQIRTAYTNRMTIGTDGSVTLATAPSSTSNNNQVATTKWVNDKGYITSSYHDSTKQDTLTSGTNIKTVNNTTLLGSGNIEIKSAPDLDNVSISKNSSDALQTIAVIDNNSNAIKTWTGTKVQYDAITTKDNNTLYNITDDVDTGTDILQMIYPVGSLYLTTNATCPLANLFGTWTLVSQDRVLQGAGSRGAVGTTLQESLPNIKGTLSASWGSDSSDTGAFKHEGNDPYSNFGGDSSWNNSSWASFDASRSSSTYQDNAPVQQNAYLINVFRRIA